MTLRTDLEVVQLPSTPPFSGLLGKNTIQADPDFLAPILRLTDASDNHNSSILTADSGNGGLWNADETMLALRTPGGGSLIYQFNPNKMRGQNLGIKLKGKVCFSGSQPSVLYQLIGSVVSKLQFHLTKGVWAFVGSTVVCDFVKILPAGFKIQWTGSFNVSMDDSAFCVGFSEGAQNSAVLCCIYQHGKGVSGFRLLNTHDGTVSGDWGEQGTIRLVSNFAKVPFSMHECSQTPNPAFAYVSAFQASSPLFWHVPTLDLIDAGVSGHAASGFLHHYAGGPGGGQIAEVSYADPTKKRLIVPAADLPASQTPPQHYTGDSHFGFGTMDPLDHSAFWATGQTLISPFTSALMNEVRGYDAMGGPIYRACHTFNSGKSQEFIAANAMAVPSPRGRFVAFASDMMGTLGSNTGQAQGTLGVDCRADVFIVKVA